MIDLFGGDNDILISFSDLILLQKLLGSRSTKIDKPPMLPPKKISPDPDYEVIDFSGEQYSNALPIKSSNGKRIDGIKCELCGSMSAKVKCDQCNQQFFCSSCDDMFHRHPKRNTHIRKVFLTHIIAVAAFRFLIIKFIISDSLQTIVLQSNIKPPLPPKGEVSMPVPPPRRNKKSTPLPTRKELVPVSMRENSHKFS